MDTGVCQAIRCTSASCNRRVSATRIQSGPQRRANSTSSRLAISGVRPQRPVYQEIRMCRSDESLTWHGKMVLESERPGRCVQHPSGSEARLTAYDTGKDFTSDGMRNVADSEVESPTGHRDVVDARFPERWLNDKRIVRLSGDAFKLWGLAILYSVANRQEGFLNEGDLRYIHDVDVSRVFELEKAGLWSREGGGWWMAEYEDTQTSLAELDAAANARRAAREKKARQRARTKQDGDPNLMSPGTSQARTGQARTGVEGEELLQQQTPNKAGRPTTPVGAGFDVGGDVKDTEDWPVAAVPGQRRDPDPPTPPATFAIIERMKAEADRT